MVRFLIRSCKILGTILGQILGKILDKILGKILVKILGKILGKISEDVLVRYAIRSWKISKLPSPGN